MVITDCTITVNDNKSLADKNIIVYRGDYNIQVNFSINQDNGFKYFNSNKSLSLIESTNAAYAQMIVKLQNTDEIVILTEVEPINDGKITLTIAKEYIDELVEVGSYDYQIRLFSEDRHARMTIPPVIGQLIVRNPIAFLDDSVAINLASADSAVLLNEEASLPAFDNEGNYIKASWAKGDVITGSKLNKIEDALYEINDNTPTAVSQLNNDAGYLTEHQDISYLATKEEIPTEVSAFTNDVEYATRGEVIANITIANMNKADKEHTHSEYITEHQDISHLAQIAYVDEQISNIELTPGPQGEQGPQGPQGEQGPAGKDADPVDLEGYATKDDLNELNTKIGDINYILDIINGEVK